VTEPDITPGVLNSKVAMADRVAEDILVARIRARNSSYSTLPDLPARQLE
jgi:hypothetical protein